MDFPEVVIAIVFIGCVTGVFHKMLDVVAIWRKNTPASPLIEGEIRALRQDVADLKALANDLVLSLDSTQQHQERRLRSLERRALGNGSSAMDRDPHAADWDSEPAHRARG